jgi:predicted nucleic acid-binding protein
MRVVLDTSVLVAAARSKSGASYAMLARMPDAGFQTVISVALFAEYRAVLLRPENLLQRTAPQAENFLDFLISTSQL